MLLNNEYLLDSASTVITQGKEQRLSKQQYHIKKMTSSSSSSFSASHPLNSNGSLTNGKNRFVANRSALVSNPWSLPPSGPRRQGPWCSSENSAVVQKTGKTKTLLDIQMGWLDMAWCLFLLVHLVSLVFGTAYLAEYHQFEVRRVKTDVIIMVGSLLAPLSFCTVVILVGFIPIWCINTLIRVSDDLGKSGFPSFADVFNWVILTMSSKPIRVTDAVSSSSQWLVPEPMSSRPGLPVASEDKRLLLSTVPLRNPVGPRSVAGLDVWLNEFGKQRREPFNGGQTGHWWAAGHSRPTMTRLVAKEQQTPVVPVVAKQQTEQTVVAVVPVVAKLHTRQSAAVRPRPVSKSDKGRFAGILSSPGVRCGRWTQWVPPSTRVRDEPVKGDLVVVDEDVPMADVEPEETGNDTDPMDVDVPGGDEDEEMPDMPDMPGQPEASEEDEDQVMVDVIAPAVVTGAEQWVDVSRDVNEQNELSADFSRILQLVNDDVDVVMGVAPAVPVPPRAQQQSGSKVKASKAVEVRSVGTVNAVGVVGGQGPSTPLPAAPAVATVPVEQANVPTVGRDDAPSGANASGLGVVPSPGRASAVGAGQGLVAPAPAPAVAAQPRGGASLQPVSRGSSTAAGRGGVPSAGRVPAAGAGRGLVAPPSGAPVAAQPAARTNLPSAGRGNPNASGRGGAPPAGRVPAAGAGRGNAAPPSGASAVAQPAARANLPVPSEGILAVWRRKLGGTPPAQPAGRGNPQPASRGTVVRGTTVTMREGVPTAGSANAVGAGRGRGRGNPPPAAPANARPAGRANPPPAGSGDAAASQDRVVPGSNSDAEIERLRRLHALHAGPPLNL